jgi:NitT/TauT family transport system substrate-binding protein
MRAKKIITLLIFILITVLISGCSGDKNETQTIKIGMLPIEDNIPFYIAEAEGLFAEAGISVELIPFDSAVQRDTALQGGQIDGEIADMVAVALLKQGGTDVKVVSIGLGGTVKEGRFAILSSPNSGITNIEQLSGGTLGISENTIIEYMADEMMDYYNLDKESVTKQQIPQMPVRMEALLADQVSAALLPDPLASLAEFQGANVIADVTEMDIRLMKTVLLFREDAIKDKQASIAKLVSIYEQSGKLLTDNPQAYRELFVEKARVPEPIQNTYQPSTFSPIQLPKQEEFQRVMDWMVAKELLSAPFAYEELTTDQFIK